MVPFKFEVGGRRVILSCEGTRGACLGNPHTDIYRFNLEHLFGSLTDISLLLGEVRQRMQALHQVDKVMQVFKNVSPEGMKDFTALGCFTTPQEFYEAFKDNFPEILEWVENRYRTCSSAVEPTHNR